MKHATLYTRQGCGLCEEAEEMLADVLPDLELRDVDASAEWVERYGLRVPVLTFDDQVVLEGRFTEAAVAALFTVETRQRRGPRRLWWR